MPARNRAAEDDTQLRGARFAIAKPPTYLHPMFEFSLPTRATIVPSGPDWLHEIKFDGYRLRLERDGDRVRLITRGGYNWTSRYRWIVEAARKTRKTQFLLDGEAVTSENKVHLCTLGTQLN